MPDRILGDDIARCHDERCEVREHCLCWTQRSISANADTRGLVHCATRRPAWQCNDELCDHALTE